MASSLIDAASKVWKSTGIVLTVLCGLGLLGIFAGIVQMIVRG